MKTLSIKVTAEMEAALQAASQREQVSRSELVRRALIAYIAQQPGDAELVSALDAAGDLVGCFSGGPPDLAGNRLHLQGYGG